MDKVLVEFDVELGKLRAELNEVKSSLAEVPKAAKKSADETSGAMNKVNNTLRSVAASVGIAFSVDAAINFGKAAVNAFAEAEKASAQLLGALKGNVQMQQNLIRSAEMMSKKLAIDDDVIVQAQAFLATMGRNEKQINDTIKAASNFAAFSNQDFMTALQQLGATFEGTKGRMGKYDEDLKKLTVTQLKNGEAIDIINKKYGDLGENLANTTAGDIERAKISWQNFTEDIGGFIVKIGGYIGQAWAWLTNSTPTNRPEFEAQQKRIKELPAIYEEAANKLKHYQDEQAKVAGNKNYVAQYKEWTAMISQQNTEIKKLEGEMKSYGLDIPVTTKPAADSIDDLRQKISDLQDQMGGMIIGSSKLAEANKQLKIWQDELTIATGGETEAMKKSKEEIDKKNEALLKHAEYLNQLAKQEQEFNKLVTDLREKNYLADKDQLTQDLAANDKYYEDLMDKYKNDANKKAILQEQYQQSITNILKKYIKQREEDAKKDPAQTNPFHSEPLDDEYPGKSQTKEQYESEVEKRKQEEIKLAHQSAQTIVTLASYAADKRISEAERAADGELKALERRNKEGSLSESQYAAQKARIEKDLHDKTIKEKRKQAKLEKDLAIFNVSLDIGQAIAKSYKLSPETFGLPWSAFYATELALEIATIAAKPLPTYGKGGKIGGKLHSEGGTLVVAEKDEWIVNRKSSMAKNEDLFALNKSVSDYERLIMKKYIAPAVKKDREGFAGTLGQNIASSLALGEDLRAIENATRKNKTVALDKSTIKALAREMSPSQKNVRNGW